MSFNSSMTSCLPQSRIFFLSLMTLLWVGTYFALCQSVYCITDKFTGKLYIGSAYSDNEGIWQHWSQYANADNLTGGNKTFEELKESGANCIIDNFTYTILEIFDTKTKKRYHQTRRILKRVFKTKLYGTNN